MDSVPRTLSLSFNLTIVTVIVLLTGPQYTMKRTVVTCCQSVVRCVWALSSPRPSGAGGQRAAARRRRRTEWKQRCSPTHRLSRGRMFHPSGSSVSCGLCAALFISNKASNCPPSSPLSRTRPTGKRADSQRRPHFHSVPINRSPPRMFPSEWAEWRGGELLNQLDNTPLVLVSPPPPPFPPPSLPPSQCDLICLVISGLACSAQLHSKVKLDKGIGASPCKTASPWQLLEWAADWSRVWRRRRMRRMEGRREGGRGGGRNGVMKDDVPERKADNWLREAPSPEGSQWWRRKLFNVETMFNNNNNNNTVTQWSCSSLTSKFHLCVCVCVC